LASDLSDGEGVRPAGGRLTHLRSTLRASRTLILFELAAVAAIFLADDVFHLIWLSKTIDLFALGALSLAARGLSWREIGVRFSPTWPTLVLTGLVAGGLIEAQELLLTQPLLIRLIGRPPDLSEFHGVEGNWKAIWLGLPLIWVLAAFGEEWVYRGYLMNRLADLFSRRRAGWVASIVLANVVFGLAHFYQGPTGMIEAGVDGILFAIVYFACGRNLIAPMVAHGVQDTIDLILGFTGNYPIAY
jgi:membrane protease YdiL (CAAX protease family)